VYFNFNVAAHNGDDDRRRQNVSYNIKQIKMFSKHILTNSSAKHIDLA